MGYEVIAKRLDNGEWTMVRFYAGLDVSDKTTHVCVVDVDGKVLWRGECATDPMALVATLTKHCRGVVRVVLETGALSSFLYHGLIERGVPAVCVCARHAKGVLSARINKSDAHDAEGLAQMARTGWFKSSVTFPRRRWCCGEGRSSLATALVGSALPSFAPHHNTRTWKASC